MTNNTELQIKPYATVQPTHRQCVKHFAFSLVSLLCKMPVIQEFFLIITGNTPWIARSKKNLKRTFRKKNEDLQYSKPFQKSIDYTDLVFLKSVKRKRHDLSNLPA